MTSNSLDYLMRTLIKKTEQAFTSNYSDISIPKNNFFTWYISGIPFEESDFEFCKIGLVGYPHTIKNTNGTEIQIDAESHTRMLRDQSHVVSTIFDFIPHFPEDNNDFTEFRNTDDMMITAFTTTQDTVSSVYKDILNFSKVYNIGPSEEDEQKIQNMKNKLVTTYQQENLATGEMETKTKPSPLMEQYIEKMRQYMDAVDNYSNLLTSAATATGNDPEAIKMITGFKSKKNMYEQKLKLAEQEWITMGYKNEVEGIYAYLDQVNRNSMLLYKKDLIAKFDEGKISSSEDQFFYYTTLNPPNLTETDWPSFMFNDGDYDGYYSETMNSWNIPDDISLGIYSQGLDFGSKINIYNNQKFASLNLTFEFRPVTIERRWFDAGFFAMRGWNLGDVWNNNWTEPISDGQTKPSGRLIAYPTTAIFVRNITLSLEEAESLYKYMDDCSKANQSIRWGPILLGGPYSRLGVKRNFQYFIEDGKIKIPGIQLIAAINKLSPKSPDPDPNFDPKEFV